MRHWSDKKTHLHEIEILTILDIPFSNFLCFFGRRDGDECKTDSMVESHKPRNHLDSHRDV